MVPSLELIQQPVHTKKGRTKKILFVPVAPNDTHKTHIFYYYQRTTVLAGVFNEPNKALVVPTLFLKTSKAVLPIHLTPKTCSRHAPHYGLRTMRTSRVHSMIPSYSPFLITYVDDGFSGKTPDQIESSTKRKGKRKRLLIGNFNLKMLSLLLPIRLRVFLNGGMDSVVPLRGVDANADLALRGRMRPGIAEAILHAHVEITIHR